MANISDRYDVVHERIAHGPKDLLDEPSQQNTLDICEHCDSVKMPNYDDEQSPPETIDQVKTEVRQIVQVLAATLDHTFVFQGSLSHVRNRLEVMRNGLEAGRLQNQSD